MLSWPAGFTKLHSTGKFITLSANSMWYVKGGNALCQLCLGGFAVDLTNGKYLMTEGAAVLARKVAIQTYTPE